MFFKGITFLIMVATVFAGSVVRNGWWEDIDIRGNGNYDGDLLVTGQGRLAYYSLKDNGRLSIQTALLGTSPLRWTTLAEEFQPPLSEAGLQNSYRKLACNDQECYFTALVGQTVQIWKADLRGTVSLEKLLQTGDGTNLGVVRQLETFVLDRNRLFVYANIGTQGLYEVSGKNLTLRVPQVVTNTLDWDRQRLFVLDSIFLFAGQREVAVKLGPDVTRVEKRYGVFRVNLASPGAAQQIVLQLESIDGKQVTRCCTISEGPMGFLVEHGVGNPPTTTSILRYLDLNGGEIQAVTEAPDIRLSNSLITGVAPVGPISWSKMLYRVREISSRGRSDTVFSWDPAVKNGTVIAKAGDPIYGNSSFAGVGRGGITADFRAVVQTFGADVTASSVRFAVGTFPTPFSVEPSSARPGDNMTIRGQNLYIPGITTSIVMGGFSVSPSQTVDGLSFRLPASVPSGQQQVTVELKDGTGTIKVVAGTVEVVNTYPLPRIAAVTSAASFQRGFLSPGSLGSLFGENLSRSGTVIAGSTPLPRELGGVQVLIQGQPAPLLFTSSGQINFQIPTELTAGPVEVRVLTRFVEGQFLQSQILQITLQPITPDVFVVANAATGLPVTRQNPVRPGDFVSVYGSGFGPVSPVVLSGHAAPAEPLSLLVNLPELKIGGVKRPVLFAGLAPGFVGLFQLNLEVPVGALAEEPIEILFPGVSVNFLLPVLVQTAP